MTGQGLYIATQGVKWQQGPIVQKMNGKQVKLQLTSILKVLLKQFMSLTSSKNFNEALLCKNRSEDTKV